VLIVIFSIFVFRVGVMARIMLKNRSGKIIMRSIPQNYRAIQKLEKGKPFERAGRKAIGLSFRGIRRYGSEVAG